MPPLNRARISEAVAEHVLDMLFDGRLRSGDRIDLDALAVELDVSRAPVREAMLLLERDGMVQMPHYRGVYAAEFSAATIREGFELYALLSVVTARKVAAQHDPAVLESMEKVWAQLEPVTDAAEFERLAREFRRVVNVAVSGPHLRALLRTFSALVPAAARFSIRDEMESEREALRKELVALRQGDPDQAGRAAAEHVVMTAEHAVRALRERGVLAPDATGEIETADVWRAVALVDEAAGRATTSAGSPTEEGNDG